MLDEFRALSDLADATVPLLRRLGEDPEHGHLQTLAADAIDALSSAFTTLSTKVDLFLCPIPPCPVGALTAWAIRGGRRVTRAEATRWARELDGWASAVDRIAA